MDDRTRARFNTDVIGPVSEGCRNISKVNFTMPGDWDVRVELSDGDSGAFIVTVDRE
jgi:hypothetical protein